MENICMLLLVRNKFVCRGNIKLQIICVLLNISVFKGVFTTYNCKIKVLK